MEESLEKKPYDNGFSKASKILGIASLVSFIVSPGVLPLVCGGVAIILGILSRGRSEMNSKAWAGVTMGAVSVGMTVVAVVVCVLLFLTNAGFRRLVNYSYVQTYGINFEDFLQQNYGEDFDITKYYIR